MEPDAPTQITPIPLERLRDAWRTATDLMENYHTGSDGWATLCEVRRLIEVEVREQYGDAVWSDLLDGGTGGQGEQTS